jgi:hypothetical protein
MAKRQKLYVDKRVQGALARRVVLYWIVCLWGTFCVMAGFPIAINKLFAFANGPTTGQLVQQAWLDFWPALAASVLVLPFVVWDVLRISHRFAGPMIRLRHGLRDLTAGKAVTPMNFRDGDFWTDFADEFNRLAESLQESKETVDYSETEEPAAV